MKFQISKLEKTTHNNPKVPFFARLADGYLNIGKLTRALELSIEGCEQFPTYPTGFVVLSRCYQAQENHEEARSALDRALRLDPENPAGFASLAAIYEQLGEFTLAVQCMQQASMLEPYSIELKSQAKRLQLLVETTKGVTKEAFGNSLKVSESTDELVEENQEASESSHQKSAASGSKEADLMMMSDLDYEEIQEDCDVRQSYEEGLFEPEPKDDSEFDEKEITLGSIEIDDSVDKVTPRIVVEQQHFEIRSDEAETLDVDQFGIEVSVSTDPEISLDKSNSDNWTEEEFSSDQKNQGPGLKNGGRDDNGKRESYKPASKPMGPSDNRVSTPSVTKFSTRDDRELVNLLSEIETCDSAYERDFSAKNIEDHVPPIPTATLAELYNQRGIVDKAIAIYKEVLRMQPEDDTIRMKLEEIEQRTKSFIIHPSGDENG